MSQIIFVNRFFWPDHSATSQILSDLAFHLAEGGREVRVVTSRLRYDGTGQGGALLPLETVRGVEVHRVATSAFGRSGLAGRALDYASFYRSAWSALMRLAQPDDIIIAKTDPPLLCVVAADAARRRSAQLINWTQDLYPEVAQKLGVAWLNGPLGHAARSLRDASFRWAAVNVAIGDLMAERFRHLGLSDERVATIPNWVGDHLIAPIPSNDNSLRRAWGLLDRFVVGYSGNLGRAHEIETLLNCAAMLKGMTDLCFLFVGGGHQFEILQQQVRARGLDHLLRVQAISGSGLAIRLARRSRRALGLLATRDGRPHCSEQGLWHCRRWPPHPDRLCAGR